MSLTYTGMVDQYSRDYRQQLEREQISSFVVPADLLNYAVLIAYLMWMRRPSLAKKTIIFLLIVTLSILSLRTSRTLGLAHGVLVGISSSLCIALSVNLVFLHHPAEVFKQKIACNHPLKPNDRVRSAIRNETQWQSMPGSSYVRLCWTFDLVGSLRALHWSYGQFNDRNPHDICKEIPTIERSFKRNCSKLLVIYLCIDCLKEVIAMDPYFWGYTEYDPPDHIRFYLTASSSVQAYRMLVSSVVLYVVIELISTIGVFLFVNILGPSFAGTWGEEWAHHPQVGDHKSIRARGLQGWWGDWWHQMFRLITTSPANAVLNWLQVPRKNAVAKVVRLVVPFLISGLIHAAGSYTMWGNTQPFKAFLFFVLQPAGIAIQMLGSWSIRRLDPKVKIPIRLRETANVAFTAIWLLKTFPLLADNFARGGLWLTEPFPISVLQTLGFGSPARSHQLWSSWGFHLHAGPRWWRMGLAV